MFDPAQETSHDNPSRSPSRKLERMESEKSSAAHFVDRRPTHDSCTDTPRFDPRDRIDSRTTYDDRTISDTSSVPVAVDGTRTEGSDRALPLHGLGNNSRRVASLAQSYSDTRSCSSSLTRYEMSRDTESRASLKSYTGSMDRRTNISHSRRTESENRTSIYKHTRHRAEYLCIRLALSVAASPSTLDTCTPIHTEGTDVAALVSAVVVAADLVVRYNFHTRITSYTETAAHKARYVRPVEHHWDTDSSLACSLTNTNTNVGSACSPSHSDTSVALAVDRRVTPM